MSLDTAVRHRLLARAAGITAPEPDVEHSWFCAVCGQPFTFRGITEVCPTCEQGGIEHITGGMSGA